MIWEAVVAAAFVLQAADKLDGYQKRRIFEATNAAEIWAKAQAEQLYPFMKLMQRYGPLAAAQNENKRNCERHLRLAAYEQVRRAYKISVKTHVAIANDYYGSKLFPFVPETEEPLRPHTGPGAWERLQTRFNAEDVRLPPKLAKKYGYVNPRESKPVDAKDRFVTRPLDLLLAPPEDFVGPPIPSCR